MKVNSAKEYRAQIKYNKYRPDFVIASPKNLRQRV